MAFSWTPVLMLRTIARLVDSGTRADYCALDKEESRPAVLAILLTVECDTENLGGIALVNNPPRKELRILSILV